MRYPLVQDRRACGATGMMFLPVPKRLLPFAIAVFALIVAVLLVAWVDGGRKDLREISQPVALPETVS